MIMKTVIKFLVIPAILLMTSCLSDVQKEVKKECNLSKIMCGYSGNKGKSEVLLDEVEARLDRFGVILKEMKMGKTDYISKQNEITILNDEMYRLCNCPYYSICFDGDVLLPQPQRIDKKIKQIEKDIFDLELEKLLD